MKTAWRWCSCGLHHQIRKQSSFAKILDPSLTTRCICACLDGGDVPSAGRICRSARLDRVLLRRPNPKLDYRLKLPHPTAILQ